jgi:hypothetical protein
MEYQPSHATMEKRMAETPRYPGIPRWVKVFGIIALVVVLLIALHRLTQGPGGRGPWSHAPAGKPSGQQP